MMNVMIEFIIVNTLFIILWECCLLGKLLLLGQIGFFLNLLLYFFIHFHYYTSLITYYFFSHTFTNFTFYGTFIGYSCYGVFIAENYYDRIIDCNFYDKLIDCNCNCY